MNLQNAQKRAELYRLLGDLPSRKEITVDKLFEEEREAYILEKLVLHLNGIEPVPAYFVRPKNMAGPSPAVVFNHSHGGFYTAGKNELLTGAPYMQTPPYAEQLTQRGYSAISIDAWGFGERHMQGRTESMIFKEMLWSGRVMWGMMVYDTLRAVDYLVTRPDVDPQRIATLGMSMGSTVAWWAAALDRRIKVCVDLCCMTDFHALIENQGLDGHGIYYYVPGLLQHFTTAQINALIAPRPHLSLNGLFDSLTPREGLDKIDAELKSVYREENAPEAWSLQRYEVGHQETPDMRSEVMAFLEKWL